MRRLALAALAAAALAGAGCGHADKPSKAEVKKRAQKLAKDVSRRARKAAREGGDVTDKALESIRKSNLPADVKKQLEDAKKQLDAQK